MACWADRTTGETRRAGFELTIALLLAATLFACLARWLRAPYPSLLEPAGTAAAFVPGAPEASPHPALALALFVAPMLLNAACDASPRDLRDNWAPVLGPGAARGGCHRGRGRGCGAGDALGAAVALGAIVAPPDASAAAAVLRQLRLPHRLAVILEDESLFNDAIAPSPSGPIRPPVVSACCSVSTRAPPEL